MWGKGKKGEKLKELAENTPTNRPKKKREVTQLDEDLKEKFEVQGH